MTRDCSTTDPRSFRSHGFLCSDFGCPSCAGRGGQQQAQAPPPPAADKRKAR
jgi:hypothetical protein